MISLTQSRSSSIRRLEAGVRIRLESEQPCLVIQATDLHHLTPPKILSFDQHISKVLSSPVPRFQEEEKGFLINVNNGSRRSRELLTRGMYLDEQKRGMIILGLLRLQKCCKDEEKIRLWYAYHKILASSPLFGVDHTPGELRLCRLIMPAPIGRGQKHDCDSPILRVMFLAFLLGEN